MIPIEWRAASSRSTPGPDAATRDWLLTQKNTHDFDDRRHIGWQQILTQEPIPIRNRRPDVPENLAAAILRALSKDPAARFESAADLRDAIRKSLTLPQREPQSLLCPLSWTTTASFCESHDQLPNNRLMPCHQSVPDQRIKPFGVCQFWLAR